MCVKGAASRQFVYHRDRVLYPLRRAGERGSGKFERISWEEAGDLIARRLLDNRERFGAASAVFYCGYPKRFRPLLFSLAKAYGSPNYCTESSTCSHAAKMAWRACYGKSCPPDLSRCRSMLVWGANYPYSKLQDARRYQQALDRGVPMVCVDPRCTPMTERAAIHLKLRPGTDGALALALGHVILREGLCDREWLSEHSVGFEEYCAYAAGFSPERAETLTGVKAEDIVRAARLLAGHTPMALQVTGSPLVHHINGVQNCRAVLLLSALTGSFDVPGGNCEPEGPRARINGLHQRESRARANPELGISRTEFPAWEALMPTEAQDVHLAGRILEGKPYPIKSLLGFGVNHMMWPESDKMLEALGRLDFFVDVDLFLTGTALHADVVLPAATSFEREQVKLVGADGLYLFRPAIRPLGEARDDEAILLDLAHRMDLHDELLDLEDMDAYHAYVLEPTGVSLEALRAAENGIMRAEKLEEARRFPQVPLKTPSGKIEFASRLLERCGQGPGFHALPVYRDYEAEFAALREEYPLILSTGCRRPQLFHSRTYRMTWLADLEETGTAVLHPLDGERLGIAQGDPVVVRTPAGAAQFRADLDAAGLPGVVYVSHGDALHDVNRLIPADYVDPLSGFPGFKSCLCRVERRDGGEKGGAES